MQIKIKDIYRIKCAIGRTLDWSDRITIESDDYGGKEGAYLRFRMSQSSVSFSSNSMVHIHSIGGRKSIKFTHLDINDSIDDCQATRKQWDRWSDRLRSTYGWHLAYAVQDGQAVEDVPSDADLVFVGGTTEWKHQTIELWCQNFPTHVGRVNTYRWLWYCHKCGAKSLDGTGWFWRNKREHQDLLDYLAITEGDRSCETGALFPIHEYLVIK